VRRFQCEELEVPQKSREVRDTNLDGVSREPEVIRAFRDTWRDGVHTYLGYLRDRLVAAHDLLAETGSIFVQIGIENCHFVGSLLDEIFGAVNRITQINFITANPQTGRYIEDNTDYLLWYAKNKTVTKFRTPYLPKPVALPPGRARLATRPSLTASSPTPKTIGIVAVAGFGRERWHDAGRGDDGHRSADQIAHQCW
jgi:hypothetical protein